MTKYGPTLKDFMKRVAPDKQVDFARKPELCVAGDYPTLRQVSEAYRDRTAASQWLAVQVADLSMFTGARNITAPQQMQLAEMIASEYVDLKVTELMLFFHRFKMGRYGRFYGAVDPMTIITAMSDFMQERTEISERCFDRDRQAFLADIEQRMAAIAPQRDDLGITGADCWLYDTDHRERTVTLSVSQHDGNPLRRRDISSRYLQLLKGALPGDVTIRWRKVK